MTLLKPETGDKLRVIVCIAFDHRAPPESIAACKAAVVNCPAVTHAVELSGTFDFLFEATVADMEAYQLQLRSCAGAVAKFASRYEANFVCKRLVRSRGADTAVWITSPSGLTRVDYSAIDKVSAEGDYVSIEADGRRWLHHTTMAEMFETLGHDFVKVHRSAIIRCGFIERLVHEGRVWSARLNDGSRERIATSQVAQVIAKLRTNSSASASTSSTQNQLGEFSAVPIERERL